MVSTLLIVGLTLFFMGTVMLAMDAQHRGRSSLMFALPFAGSSYIRHFWSDVWLAALLRVAGATLVVVSAAVAVARDPEVLEQPRRLFGVNAPAEMVGSKRAEINTFANSQEAVLLAIRSDANPKLSGRLRGQPFLYSNAKLVGGVLSAQQGDGFIPEIEVRILLDLDPSTVSQQRQTFYVRPADDSAPELQITWREEDGSTPHTEIIRGGYQMELQLTRRSAHTLTGFLQIILPDPDRSYLSGELTVRTNNLHFVGDRVDLTYDHPDTLEYVGRQYLETQFPEKTISNMQFRDTRLLMSESGGVSVATVVLVNGRVEERVLQFDRADIGWAVRPGKVETRVLVEGGNQQQAVMTPDGLNQRGSAPVDVPPPVTLEFGALDSLSGQQATIHQADGRTREGILRGLRRNRLLIEANVAGGAAEFSFAEQELKRLVLANGQQVLLAGVVLEQSDSPEVRTDLTEAPATDTSQESSQQAMPDVANQSEFAKMIGREVTIISRDTRTRTGILTAATERQLTLSVRVGAGSLEYFYSPGDVVSITEVKR